MNHLPAFALKTFAWASHVLAQLLAFYTQWSLKNNPGSQVVLLQMKNRNRGTEEWSYLLVVLKDLNLGALTLVLSVMPLDSEVQGTPT